MYARVDCCINLFASLSLLVAHIFPHKEVLTQQLMDDHSDLLKEVYLVNCVPLKLIVVSFFLLLHVHSPRTAQRTA